MACDGYNNEQDNNCDDVFNVRRCDMAKLEPDKQASSVPVNLLVGKRGNCNGIGDDFKKLVLSRTGLKETELSCPREKSDMTPCVARDRDAAMTEDGYCVGCGASVKKLLKDETAKHA
jgi:hypothetical protein